MLSYSYECHASVAGCGEAVIANLRAIVYRKGLLYCCGGIMTDATIMTTQTGAKVVYVWMFAERIFRMGNSDGKTLRRKDTPTERHKFRRGGASDVAEGPAKLIQIDLSPNMFPRVHHFRAGRLGNHFTIVMHFLSLGYCCKAKLVRRLFRVVFLSWCQPHTICEYRTLARGSFCFYFFAL